MTSAFPDDLHHSRVRKTDGLRGWELPLHESLQEHHDAENQQGEVAFREHRDSNGIC